MANPIIVNKAALEELKNIKNIYIPSNLRKSSNTVHSKVYCAKNWFNEIKKDYLVGERACWKRENDKRKREYY